MDVPGGRGERRWLLNLLSFSFLFPTRGWVHFSTASFPTFHSCEAALAPVQDVTHEVTLHA